MYDLGREQRMTSAPESIMKEPGYQSPALATLIYVN